MNPGENKPRREIRDANAKLIAAAPDLLEALKKAMHCLTAETEKEWLRSQKHEESPYHFIWAAIQKAGGP
jgi:hypothetical protein